MNVGNVIRIAGTMVFKHFFAGNDFFAISVFPAWTRKENSEKGEERL